MTSSSKTSGMEHVNMTNEEKTLPFQLDHLPEEIRKKAAQELNETPENEHLLQELKQKAKLSETMKDYNFHEDVLRQFLRHAKYNVEKAHSKLQTSVRIKLKNSQVFEAVDFDKVSKTTAYQFCTPLPWRCRDGCPILVFQHGKWLPKDISSDDLFRIICVVVQQSLRNPVEQITGYKSIIDCKNTSLRHIIYATPSNLFTFYQSFTDGVPARYKEIHVINESMFMKVAWTIGSVFLGEKLRSRILFHSSPKDLLNYFSKHALPVEYGGELENYYMEDWVRKANEQQRMCTIEGQENIF